MSWRAQGLGFRVRYSGLGVCGAGLQVQDLRSCLTKCGLSVGDGVWD